MKSTMQQVRAWQGPALLSYGFRPFFLGAAMWAVLSMSIWLGVLSGLWSLQFYVDPIAWHAHEFLFGYLGCVAAGFLLTAVPNWTGQMPIVGWPLGALFALWMAGRAAVGFSAGLPYPAVAMIDLAFPVVLFLVIGREIVAGRNWRNLPVLAVLGALTLGNGIFHWEAAGETDPARGYGLRLGLAAGVMLIALVGGRIVPSFTRNWLVKRGGSRLPKPPMQAFDRLALVVLGAAVAFWVAWPQASATGLALVVAGGLHFIRLGRWAGGLTLAEPLVAVLHAGYAFVPLGAVMVGATILAPAALPSAPALHLWMAGAIGLMTLAIMTRATLGHTGHALKSGPGTTAAYLMVVAAVATRFFAGVIPGAAAGLHIVSGLFWIGAFLGFLALYGPLLAAARKEA